MKSKIGSSAPIMAPEKALHPLRERERERERDKRRRRTFQWEKGGFGRG
jgi:hypothetical protein